MPCSYNHNQSLGYQAGLASRLLNRILAVKFLQAGIDMTAEQWGAILVLLNEGAMTQGLLGERLSLEKSTVSRLTDGLERRGWITRTADPADSRKKLVAPTRKAMDATEPCAKIAGTTLKEARQGLSEEEMLTLASLLSRVNGNLRELIE